MNAFICSLNGWHVKTLDGIGMGLAIPMQEIVIKMRKLSDRTPKATLRSLRLSKILKILKKF